MKVSDRILAIFPKDKLMHFIVGALLFAVVFAVMQWLEVGDQVAMLSTSLCIVVVAAAVKEMLVDEYIDMGDFVATAIGGLFILIYTAIIL